MEKKRVIAEEEKRAVLIRNGCARTGVLKKIRFSAKMNLI